MGIDIKGALRSVGSVVSKGIEAGKTVTQAVGKEVSQVKDAFEGVVDKAQGVVNALTGKSADAKYDGALVDSTGKTYPPGTPLSQIEPKGSSKPTIIEVNGVGCAVANQTRDINAVEQLTGARVVGLHNATEGTVRDLTQALLDKLDLGKNLAADSLADTVYSELKGGQPVHIMAHSQGALVTSRGLEQVKQRLMMEDGMSKAEAEKLLDNVHVETFGGASSNFPDGPQYVHYVNRADIVPWIGVGGVPAESALMKPGRGAQIHYFTQHHPERIGDNHSLDKTYFLHRVPFAEARRGDFSHPGTQSI